MVSIGRDITQRPQGQAKGKKPTGDTGPRFNADPRMPVYNKAGKELKYGSDDFKNARRGSPGSIARAGKRKK